MSASGRCVWEKSGRAYLVFEIALCDFDAVLRNETLEKLEVGWYFGQMLEAVHQIHERRVAHMDLKPGNFLFFPGDPHAQVKLGDFGLARQLAPDRDYFSTEGALGTVAFMAPEVIYQVSVLGGY